MHRASQCVQGAANAAGNRRLRLQICPEIGSRLSTNEPNFRAFGKHDSGSVNFGLRNPQQLLVRVLLLRQTPFFAGTTYPVAKITAVRTTLGIEKQCALLACRRGQVLGICTGTYNRRARGCVPSALAISVPCNVMGARWGRGWPGGNPTSRERRAYEVHTYSYALNHRGAALPRESGRPTGGARVPDFWAVRPGPRDSPQADVPGPRGPKRLFCSKYLARACATGCCPGCLLASDVHNTAVVFSRAPKCRPLHD